MAAALLLAGCEFKARVETKPQVETAQAAPRTPRDPREDCMLFRIDRTWSSPSGWQIRSNDNTFALLDAESLIEKGRFATCEAAFRERDAWVEAMKEAVANHDCDTHRSQKQKFQNWAVIPDCQ